MSSQEVDEIDRATSGGLPSEEQFLGGSNWIGYGWSDDLLLLMSVESEALREKVERFRHDELGYNDPAENAEWQRRRAALKKWLETSKPP